VTDNYDTAKSRAEEIGAEHGRNAAAWFEQETIGGRVSGTAEALDTARRILRGIADGDPEILDALPGPDLSGQWADGYLPRDLARDCGLEDEESDPEGDEILAELCDAYEDAFRTAVTDHVTDACRTVVGIAADRELPEFRHGR
jgi:hypothetical protein